MRFNLPEFAGFFMTEIPRREPITSINYFNPIENLALSLGFKNLPEFGRFLENSWLVVDVGSGYDGLALGALFYDINAKVVSVNPDRQSDSFAKGRLSTSLQWINSHFSPEELQSLGQQLPGILQAHFQIIDSQATKDMADNLSLPDTSAGAIIDSFAASYYMLEEEFKGRFEKTIGEYLRVLKPGGEVLIADPSMFNSQGDWKLKVIQELGIDYQTIKLKKDNGIEVEWGIRFVKAD